MQRAAAWAVHVFTASGAVLGLLMLHLAYQGEVRAVLWLFLLSMFIDGVDGFLARHFRVKELVPEFDGALLDNIVDYLTYVIAPMALLWAAGYLPAGAAGGVVAAVPVLASCYQFCRADAKTEDHFFLGFPSYWNVLAFYVVVLGLSPSATTVLLLVFAVLVFVPIKYVYPSRTETLWYANMAGVSAWFVVYAAMVALLPDVPVWLTTASLAYLAYYTAVSFWLTFRTASTRRSTSAASV